ncbi:tripartite tricarboxylate transporter substrate binding protein [Pseudacidovorax sp. RU35E]|uniref:Bug family tripartite tricarboxylate transporter substrate binding protein n=1 Tax=Pseudacidovorax sp. RU35E TaxID=1907403 RepID=UPI0009558A5B|nr:tripartite tricarboxylate transporter substrate binding protein [Pseudacidovorax sp. RU35E]SIP90947.1 Tripartite-type tricarboxylate transporter, receptor component TctC [Pseudacidovorax sp. RU35E]
MKRRSLLSAAAALPFAAVPAWAQDSKPIQIIVPFGPGGSGDISARMLAEFITRKTGRNVVVDNRAGGNGIIGVEAARIAPADGSVLLLATTSTHLANPSLFRKLPYDPARDFRLVGSFGPGSTYMLVRPDAPWKTLKDFVAAAKAAPGRINYGHFNATSKVTAALFAHEAGIELAAIPYKQVSQAMTELIAGQTQVVFTDTVAGDSFVAANQLRALAAHSDTRLKRYPDVPLIAETYPNFTIRGGFLGIAVPAATPVDVQQRLNALINEAVTTDPIRSRLEGFAFAPARVSLKQLADFEREEREKWKGYVEIAQIEVQ